MQSRPAAPQGHASKSDVISCSPPQSGQRPRPGASMISRTAPSSTGPELLALLGGELRPRIRVQSSSRFADDLGAQLVGGGLQCRDASATARKVLPKPIHAVQLLLDEAVAVEVIGGLEREERGHPHHHRAQGFVAEVEVVVREAAALAGEDPVIWILGGVFGGADAKARPCSMLLKMK